MNFVNHNIKFNDIYWTATRHKFIQIIHYCGKNAPVLSDITSLLSCTLHSRSGIWLVPMVCLCFITDASAGSRWLGQLDWDICPELHFGWSAGFLSFPPYCICWGLCAHNGFSTQSLYYDGRWGYWYISRFLWPLHVMSWGFLRTWSSCENSWLQEQIFQEAQVETARGLMTYIQKPHNIILPHFIHK